MSFAGEMDDFIKAFETGSRIQLNWRNADLVKSKTKQKIRPGQEEEVPSSFGGEPGGGIGVTNAPREGGGKKTGGREPNPNSLAAGYKNPQFDHYRRAISSIESGSPEGNYRALGKVVNRQGDRALGRYQIMASNLPAWSKQVIGQEMTVDQFLNDPEAQDKIFDGTFVPYVVKYGERGAASMWFTGSPNEPNRTDAHGKLTGKTYADQFVKALGNKANPNLDPGKEIAIPEDAWWGPTDENGRPLREKKEEDQDAVEAIPDESDTPTEEVDVVIDVPEAPEQQPIEAQLVPNEEPVGMQYGGAIPDEDDTQYFAAGGAAKITPTYGGAGVNTQQPANPSAVGGADKYNAGRAYTQPIAQQPKAAVARRISIPTGGQEWQSWGKGTPSQLGLRKAQSDLAAKRKADAAAAAAAAAKKKAAEVKPVVKKSLYHPYQPVGGGGDRAGSAGYTTSGREGAGGFGQATSSATQGGWGGGWSGGGMGGHSGTSPSSSAGTGWSGGGMGGRTYEEGGIVAFERGGKIPTVTPEQWKKALARERPTPVGGRAESAGMSARDTAAKRLNQQIRGVTSSAIRIAKPAAAAATVTAPTRRPKTGAPKKIPIPGDKPPREGGGGLWSSPDRWTYDQNKPDRAKIFKGGQKPDAGTGEPMKPLTKAEQDAGVPWNSPRRFRTNPNKKAAPYNSGKVTITVPKESVKVEEAPVLWSSPKGKPNAGTTKFQEGGAIPDDTQSFAQGGRAEAAAYQTPRPRKPKADPWAGLRTKTSTKKRPRSATKRAGRQAAKKPGKRRQYEETPGRAPTPTAKPAANVPTPTPRPSREAAPRGGETFGSDLLRPIGDLPPARQPFKPADTQGAQPPPPPNARVAPRKQPAPTKPYRGHPGVPGAPVVGSGHEVIGRTNPVINLTINQPPPVTAPRPFKPADIQGAQPPPEPNARPSLTTVGAEGYGEEQPAPEEMEATPWLAFQQGGAIPDEGVPYPNPSAGAAATPPPANPNVASATEAPPSTPQPAGPEGGSPDEQEETPTSPVPPESDVDIDEAKAAAAPAVAAAIDGIQKIFKIGGGQQQGGIPSPEDEAAHEDGIRRFAQGEGASTKEEINAIDFATGVDQIHADEGTKNLIRVDRVMQWYLQNGDEDRAKTAAVSVLLYGANQVKQAGMMAAAALDEYQKTGDPQDLRNASLAVQRAHAMIPDGFNMKIDIDPNTRQIVATTVDKNGKQQQHIVDPESIPQLLQSAMDGSAYWSTVFAIGQPEIARARETGRNAAARQEDTQAYEQYKFERNEGAKVETEERAAARKLWEHERDTSEGRTENEREDRVKDAFFQDWAERTKQAETPEEKNALANEGLGYRYENTRDRSDPVLDDDIVNAVQERGSDYDDADRAVLAEIARSLAMKNDGLDASGAAQYATALVTEPTNVRSDGTLAVGGASLVFNPLLLPPLNELRRKYKGG